MTREEAIQVLKRTVAYESDFAEAKRMAISALSTDEPKVYTEDDYWNGKVPQDDRADAIEAKPEYRNEDMWDKEKSTYNKGWNDCNDAWVAIIKALPSADAVQRWIPFTSRPMTEEEQKDYPNCTFIFDCVLPDDGDEILVSNRRFVWMDTFCNDIDGCYLDGGDDIDEDMAWMPLPKPYKGGDTE